MIDRRTFVAAVAATLAAPHLRASTPFETATARARSFPQLNSLLIVEDGVERVALSLRGPGLDAAQNVKSVSKSIVSLLLGTVVDRAEVSGVSATLGQVAPRLLPDAADPRAADITLEDLVTLRAGLERTSGPAYGQWVASPNWVADALARPFVAEPGGRMLYSTGSTHILGAALSEITGVSLHTLARDRLARPLGIDIPPWTRDPQGRFLGGNEMAVSPRALARIGRAVANGGELDGTRIVSQDWLDASFRQRTRSPWSGLGYGYGWFLGRAGGADYALARGYGGQVLMVAPSRGRVVVITSDPTQPARSDGYFGDLMRLIEEDILAA